MSKGVNLNTIEELWRFAQFVFKAGIRKSSIKSAEQALCIIQHGAEVGMPPMTALKCITIKGDIPTIDGDGAMALVKACDEEEWTRVGFSGTGATAVGWCETKRKGQEPHRREFSFEDAKKAGLLGKGLKMYELYPQRMFTYRAIGFCLRDIYPDILGGLHLTEEIDDTLETPNCQTPARADRRKPAQDVRVTDTPAGTTDPEPVGISFTETVGQFVAVTGVDGDDAQVIAMFQAYAADELACPVDDISEEKCTPAMLSKIQAGLAAMEKK